jgi:hypothetical protein
MPSYKFSFIILFIFLSNVSAFDDMSCLKSNFSVTIAHKAMPFGLTKNILGLTKEGCYVTVHHQRLKYINRKWEIDICRTPVHIKKGAGAVDVLKKTKPCKRTAGGFCNEKKTLQTLIQDDGLIFAKGDKESIDSDHGKVYCTHLLLRSYLDRDIVFSTKKEYKDLLEAEVITPPAPEKPKVPVVKTPPRPMLEGESNQVDKKDELSDINNQTDPVSIEQTPSSSTNEGKSTGDF